MAGVGSVVIGYKGGMVETHDYQVEITSTGLKTGWLAAAADGLPALDVASPPEFDGPEGVWSPEHLFVASLAACLMTTFRAIAEASGVEVLAYDDRVTGRLSLADDRLYRIERVTLRPEIVIADADQVDKARRLLDKAERACLISRSVNSQIELDGSIRAAQPQSLSV
jgi:organic hydroperoxide reductase OsmC/OhrA